ncbi:MAG: hypothetical protein ACOC6H_02580 [Thermoproteota archaeon]
MKKVELETLKDLAYLAINSPDGVIQHCRVESGGHIYYIISGSTEETFVFYVKNEEVTNRFLCINTSRDEIEYSNRPIMDPRTTDIPIVHVKKQDILKFE